MPPKISSSSAAAAEAAAHHAAHRQPTKVLAALDIPCLVVAVAMAPAAAAVADRLGLLTAAYRLWRKMAVVAKRSPAAMAAVIQGRVGTIRAFQDRRVVLAIRVEEEELKITSRGIGMVFLPAKVVAAAIWAAAVVVVVVAVTSCQRLEAVDLHQGCSPVRLV